MNQSIRLDGHEYDVDADALQAAIAAVKDIRETRPVCMCRRDEPPEMYVASVNRRFVVKRMPNTAHLHHPTCASYEAPRAVSGIAEVEGRAILHDAESDWVTLKLAFSLSKNNSSHAAAQAPTPPDSAKTSIARLSLRATIDYLWDAAQLNRWNPNMAGKRNYSVVHKYVCRAVAHTLAKRSALAETLYMPEPFYSAEAAEIRQRAERALVRCAFQRTGKQSLMLMFGEVKAFSEARQGAVVQIKHAPFVQFYLLQELNTKMLRIFDAELSLWNARPELHLIMLGTFAQNAAGMYEIAEVALMVVDEGWIPVASLRHVQLFERLAGEGRAFLRGLRFNADEHARFADVLLTDTERPTAVYFTSGTESEGDIGQLACECEEMGIAALFLREAELRDAALPPTKAKKP